MLFKMVDSLKSNQTEEQMIMQWNEACGIRFQCNRFQKESQQKILNELFDMIIQSIP